MIVIAQCTDSKRRERSRAKDMYMPSDLFKAQRRYAEAYGDEWYILSGKYGLVRPWDWLQPYNQHIRHHSDDWNEQVGQRIKTIAKKDETVEIIAGKEEYGSRLEHWLDEYEVGYCYPFEGLGIGERTKAMVEEARKVENQSLERYA